MVTVLQLFLAEGNQWSCFIIHFRGLTYLDVQNARKKGLSTLFPVCIRLQGTNDRGSENRQQSM